MSCDFTSVQYEDPQLWMIVNPLNHQQFGGGVDSIRIVEMVRMVISVIKHAFFQSKQ
jgi:hypothetical protein